MFSVAITNSSIAHSLQSFDVEELRVKSSVVTIATDGFLSKSFSESNGFSVIESPLISYDSFQDIVFSKVTYRKEDNVFEVFKSTISGRPVYYHINSKGEFFCSTHISMLRKAGVTIEENTEALPEFFVYRYVMPPQTLYKNIYQLVAGSRLSVKLVDGKCVVKSVDGYSPPEQDKRPDPFDGIVKQTLNRLSQSLEALGPCKDRLAVLLSGGLDSSILFKICQAHYGIDTTFSTEYPFEDPNKNMEREYAVSAADAFATRHRHYKVTTKDYFRGFLEAICAAEEPLHHLQSVLFYLLFKEGLPQSNDIVVSGQGADGIWGLGLNNQVYVSEKMPFRLLSKHPILKLLKIASHVTGQGQSVVRFLSKTKEHSTIEDPDNVIWSLGRHGSEDWVCKYFGVTKYDVINNRLNTVKPFLDRSIHDVISILDFLGDVAITQSIWSKLGESHRRILYYPFNQDALLDYAYRIPWDMKLAKPKNILRGVARHLEIPEFIVTRRKSGFGVVRRDWAEKGGVFEPLVPLASKVFDEEQIRDMQSVHLKKAMTFWNILNYSIWKRLFINSEPIETLLEELHEVLSEEKK